MESKGIIGFAPLPDTYEDTVVISREHKDRINAAFVRYVSELQKQADELTAARAAVKGLSEALESFIKAEFEYVKDMYGKDSADLEALKEWEPYKDAHEALTTHAAAIKDASNG